MKLSCDENGNCICINCGTTVPHKPGNPCREQKCPKCGRAMLRENGYHHKLYLQKMTENQSKNETK